MIKIAISKSIVLEEARNSGYDVYDEHTADIYLKGYINGMKNIWLDVEIIIED